MFDKKVSTLFDSTDVKNQFIEEGMKETSVVLSGNGAKKYSTSGDDFVEAESTSKCNITKCS